MMRCGFLLASIGVALPSASALTVGRHSQRTRHHPVSQRDEWVNSWRRPHIEEALGRLPAKVGDLFTAFSQVRDDRSASSLLQELNAIYNNAMSQNDTVTLDCLGKAANFTEEERIARVGLHHMEARLTQVQDRMQMLQAGVDRSQAEIQTMRFELKQNRATCDQNTQRDTDLLANLTWDLPIAKSLLDSVRAECTDADLTADGPALLECSMPDGAVVATFKEKASRIEASKLSDVTQRLLSGALDAAAHGSQGSDAAAAASLLRISSRKRRFKKRSHRRHRDHRRHRGSHQTPILNAPEHLCTDARPVTCIGFVDAMTTFIGSVQDFIDELKVRIEDNKKECHMTSQDSASVVQQLKQQANEGSIALANMVAEHSSLTGLRRQRLIQLQDVTREAQIGASECTEQLSHIAETLCSTRVLGQQFKELNQLGTGSFVGDCEVGGWIPGPCSKLCGSDGVQRFTRRVVTGVNDAQCPILELSRPCNVKPCPIDAEMGRWEDWTACSRPCGGGTRIRHRNIVQEEKYGGVPSAETTQEELCNPEACDRDCELSSWTDWSDCSKACMGGHQVRVRKVTQAPVGQGTCPAVSDSLRRQSKSCNVFSCNKTDSEWPKCASAVDMAILIDGSGSVGSRRFNKAGGFAKKLIANMVPQSTAGTNIIDPKGPLPDEDTLGAVRVGIVKFSTSAVIVHDFDDNQDTLAEAAGNTGYLTKELDKAATNTAAALAVARRMRESLPLHPNTASVVVVVTDGAPSSGRLTREEVDRLKEAGTRVMFVSVGGGIPAQSLEQWVSWPMEENIVEVASYKELSDSVRQVVVNVCPRLSCGDSPCGPS